MNTTPNSTAPRYRANAAAPPSLQISFRRQVIAPRNSTIRAASQFRNALTPALALMLFLTTSSRSPGIDRSWNSASDGNWNVAGNWTPPGVPDTNDNATLGDVLGTEGTRTTLDINDTVGILTMVNGNDFDTASFEFIVDSASISGTGTTLLVKPNNAGANDSFDADFMNVNSDGTIKMLGGRIEIDGNTGSGQLALSGSQLSGYGFIDLEASGAGSKLYLGDSTLYAGYTADGVFLTSDSARTLEINAVDAGATVDLDQGNSIVNLGPAGTLDLNVALNDPFGSTMNLSRKSTLDVQADWDFDGTMNVNTQAGVFPGQSAGPTTITGGAFTQTGGSINLDNAVDHLIIAANSVFSGGTINHDAGTIEVNSSSNVYNTGDFQVGSATELIVNGSLIVNDADWNWDGDGGTDNVITINDNGYLEVHVAATGADDIWSGLMHINGGSLYVQGTNDDWGNVSSIMVGGTTESSITGDRFNMTGGSLTVSSGANLLIDANTAPAGSPSQNFSGGTVTVNGILDLNGEFTEWAGATVTGTGRIEPGTNTVSANQTIGVTTYDWDTGTTTVNSGVTLTLNVDTIEIGTTDGFDGTLNLDSGIVAVNTPDPWRMEGTANLDNTGGGNPTINGSRMVVGDAGGSATVNVTGGLSIINAPLTVETNGTIDIATGGAILTVNGDTIYDGGLITGSGTFNPPSGSSNTVVSDTTIDVDLFNFDRGHWLVEAGATLTVAVADYDSDSPVNVFDVWTTIESGAINATSDDPQFVHDGNLEFYNTNGTAPVWSGDPLYFGGDSGSLDANLNVHGPGESRIGTSVTFFSDADVFIEPGATLRTGTATFESVNGAENAEFTGSGMWKMAGTNTFNETTTLNMTGGTVDLDNSGGLVLVANDTHVNANTTINVATLSSYGVYSSGAPPIIPRSNSEIKIATGILLTVNLDDPNGEWTVNSSGRINYSGNATPSYFLSGSDLNMAGILNVTGDGRTDARIDISGTVNALTVGEPFRMAGGNLTDDPNWLLGGTINGPGLIGAASGSALFGYGTINADVDFDVISHLLADNGTLTVNGAIIDAYYIGTNDTDGILDVPTAWNSSPVVTVLLRGGELSGGTLTIDNTNGIQGFGEVSAPVVNNTRIQAGGGGTLRMTNTSSDWDGTTETGQLKAINGNLEIVDNSGFVYSGAVSIGNGRELFVNGFNLVIDSGATLAMTGGSLRSNTAQSIQGTLTVNTNPSSLDTAVTLDSTAVVTLNNNLHLNGDTTVQTGATIAGGGVLVNGGGATLTLPDGFSLAVQLDNDGSLVLGTSPGQVSGTVFTQSATGTLNIEIAGTNPSEIDSLALSTSAQLGGTLKLSLLGGFSPTLGQTFTILTALSRTGEFDTVIQPATMPTGLAFDVIYNPTNVQLKVVVAGAYQEWIDSFTSLTDPADKVKTANPDNDGMNNFTEFAFDDDPTTGVASGKIVGKIAPVGGVDVLTLTCPVRTGAVEIGPAGGDLTLQQATDGVVYTVEASDDLESSGLTVTEVTGADATAIQAGLPALSGGGWEYRTFRSPGPVAGDPREFMRVSISETP